MANLEELDEFLRDAGIDEVLLNLDAPQHQPIAHAAGAAYPSISNSQGIPLSDLAADIGKIYMAIFNEYLIHRYGHHWPMTVYFNNNGQNPWDMTLVVPNPRDHLVLPTANSQGHPNRFEEIRDTLIALADEWSLNIKFL